jgi:hypothetical protein
MLKRRTLHECANELDQISKRFKDAHLQAYPMPAGDRDRELRSTSVEGVELLRMLALVIRSGQDSGSLPESNVLVGALKSPASQEEIYLACRSYRPPYTSLPLFAPMLLREGLNKIAHANAAASGFAVDADNHDLVLSGSQIKNGQDVLWVAVLSIPHICDGIKTLPDREILTA